MGIKEDGFALTLKKNYRNDYERIIQHRVDLSCPEIR